MRQPRSAKEARQLPGRGALNDLGATQRTINDYSKATPIVPLRPTPNFIQNLGGPLAKPNV